MDIKITTLLPFIMPFLYCFHDLWSLYVKSFTRYICNMLHN